MHGRRRRRRSTAIVWIAAWSAAAWLAAGCAAGRARTGVDAAAPAATLLPTSSACPRLGQAWLRSAGASYMVAELLGDTAAALPASAVATDGGSTSAAAPATSAARGRIVRVVRAGGVPAGTLAGDGAEALLVYWGTVGDCRPTALPPDALAAAPGERVFISGLLRSREQWVAGRPTLDVYATPHLYVPSRERPRWAGTADSIPAGAELLTADEYFTVYEALPTRDQWDQRSQFARRRVRRWMRANAALAAKEPAARIFRDMGEDRRRKY